jgi:hypothetical protein
MQNKYIILLVFVGILLVFGIGWVFLSPCSWRPWASYDDDGNCVTSCPNGKGDVNNDKKCQTCNTGYIGKDNICTQCLEGEGVVNNTCELCKPGEYGQNGICYQCNINTTSNLGATSCTSCGNHKISNEDNTGCDSCASTPYRRIDGFENACVRQGECVGSPYIQLYTDENDVQSCIRHTFVKNTNTTNSYGGTSSYYFCGPPEAASLSIDQQKTYSGSWLTNEFNAANTYGAHAIRREKCIYDESSNKWKLTTTFIPQLSSENNIEHKCSNLILWSEDDINNALTGVTHDRNGVELTQEIKNKQKEKLRSCNFVFLVPNVGYYGTRFYTGTSTDTYITDVYTNKTYPKLTNTNDPSPYRYNKEFKREDGKTTNFQTEFRVSGGSDGLTKYSKDSEGNWTIYEGVVFDGAVSSINSGTFYYNFINSSGIIESTGLLVNYSPFIIDQRDPQVGVVRYLDNLARRINYHKLWAIMIDFNMLLRNKYNIENKNERTWEIIDGTTKEPKTIFTSRDGNVVKENMVWPVTEDLYVLTQWIFGNFPLEGMTLEYYYSFIRQVLRTAYQGYEYVY